MLLRSAAAALLAMAACVTVDDEPVNELPLPRPAAPADGPALDVLADRLPPAPPSWTDHRPVPGPDHLSTFEDGDVKATIEQLLQNDLEPDGGRVVFVGLGVDAGGTASVVENRVVFTPDPDFTGDAFFDYVISDGRLMATGRVKITVLPVNDAPIAFPDSIRTITGAEITFRLDTLDVDGDPLSIEILSPPSHGFLSTAGDTCSYMPASAFTGTDHITYRVSDGTAWSDPTTIDLEVTPN
jgi:hypothetical protein